MDSTTVNRRPILAPELSVPVLICTVFLAVMILRSALSYYLGGKHRTVSRRMQKHFFSRNIVILCGIVHVLSEWIALMWHDFHPRYHIAGRDICIVLGSIACHTELFFGFALVIDHYEAIMTVTFKMHRALRACLGVGLAIAIISGIMQPLSRWFPNLAPYGVVALGVNAVYCSGIGLLLHAWVLKHVINVKNEVRAIATANYFSPDKDNMSDDTLSPPTPPVSKREYTYPPPPRGNPPAAISTYNNTFQPPVNSRWNDPNASPRTVTPTERRPNREISTLLDTRGVFGLPLSVIIVATYIIWAVACVCTFLLYLFGRLLPDNVYLASGWDVRAVVALYMPVALAFLMYAAMTKHDALLRLTIRGSHLETSGKRSPRDYRKFSDGEESSSQSHSSRGY